MHTSRQASAPGVLEFSRVFRQFIVRTLLKSPAAVSPADANARRDGLLRAIRADERSWPVGFRGPLHLCPAHSAARRRKRHRHGASR